MFVLPMFPHGVSLASNGLKLATYRGDQLKCISRSFQLHGSPYGKLEDQFRNPLIAILEFCGGGMYFFNQCHLKRSEFLDLQNYFLFFYKDIEMSRQILEIF